jgi:hypothetical protein
LGYFLKMKWYISVFFSHLDHSRRETSLGGLTVLAKNRKKQHLINVLESLGTIKTLVSCWRHVNVWYRQQYLIILQSYCTTQDNLHHCSKCWIDIFAHANIMHASIFNYLIGIHFFSNKLMFD